MMTWISVPRLLISLSRSMPLMPGILTSVTTTSRSSAARCFNASSPEFAEMHSYPARSNFLASALVIAGSSSTTRIFATLSSSGISVRHRYLLQLVRQISNPASHSFDRFEAALLLL